MSKWSEMYILGIFSTIVIAIALDISAFPIILPAITDTYESSVLSGWYGSAYLLAFGVAYPIFTPIYTTSTSSLRLLSPLRLLARHYNSTPGSVSSSSSYLSSGVFMLSVLIFGLGNLLGYLTNVNSNMILVRAACGIGVAGIFSGLKFFSVVLFSSSKHMKCGILLLLHALFRFVGPVIGASITSRSGPSCSHPSCGWQTLFLINAVLASLTLSLILIPWVVYRKQLGVLVSESGLINVVESEPRSKSTLTFLLGNAAIVCCLLALFYGSTDQWISVRVISLLVAGTGGCTVILTVITCVWRTGTGSPNTIHMGDTVFDIMLRGVIPALWGASFYSFYYFYPMWLISVRGHATFTAGIMYLPLAASYLFNFLQYFASLDSAFYMFEWPRTNQAISLGIMALSAGLSSRLTSTSSNGMVLGLQFLFSFGAGAAVFEGGVPLVNWRKFRSGRSSGERQATLIVNFPGSIRAMTAETIGGSIGIVACQAIFTSLLSQDVSTKDQDFSVTLRNGTTNFRAHLTGDDIRDAVDIYNHAITRTFFVATGAGALPWSVPALFLALIITPPGLCLVPYFLYRRRKAKASERVAPPPPMEFAPLEVQQVRREVNSMTFTPAKTSMPDGWLPDWMLTERGARSRMEIG